MREYEFVYVIQPDATPEREAEIHQRIDQVVADQNGRFLLRDDWGKRRLAYEIKKFQKGHYFQVNFLGSGKEIGEIERLMRIDSDVLRYLSVLADEEVTDIETRVVEAAKQAAEQAQRRAEDALLTIQGALVLARARNDAGIFRRALAELMTRLLAP